MQITKIQPTMIQHYNNNNNRINVEKQNVTNNAQTAKYAEMPVTYKYGVSFGTSFDPNRNVPDINHEEYIAMSDVTKRRYRKIYRTFGRNPFIDKEELFKPTEAYMPLQTEKNMDEFIKTAKMYSQYKDQPIICLGRSPKWFLNAALWMKDGIKDYTFVAFSKYWYRPDPVEGLVKNKFMAPTETEIKAYRKYLKRIKADPERIVKHFEKTGEKTVITDYICSGKGACSFLEVMADYADDLGILKKFAKSIQIVAIGCRDYMEDLDPYAESISDPKVPMPEKLIPYSHKIPQTFHNMDYGMFREMLLNENTNECRSTYYPHETWTIYKPDQFKTGLISDMKKVKKMVKELGESNEKSMASFSPAMSDYRNLLNFRILDALNERGILKLIHKSKI